MTDAEMIAAVAEHGGIRTAARALGVHHSKVQRAVRRQAEPKPQLDAARSGLAPYVIKGMSTLRDGDGNVKQEWTKTALNAELQQQAVEAHIRWLAEEVRGLSPYIAPPAVCDDDLLVVYPMGDPHFGLYSWVEETGENFDLAMADELTRAAIGRLVATAPSAGTGLLLNLGDAFHADDSRNMTPGHGNQVDVDGRYAKVIEVGARAMIHCALRLLEKHKRVVVWNLPGNHDPHASFALAIAMKMFFENEPRVEVDLSPSLFRYLKFGKNLIGSHHGHGTKGSDLPLLMATDRPIDWGETEFRVWYCGHIHHYTAREYPGCNVETFRTLAAKDAWHTGKGYRSGRDMTSITIHREWGEVQRTRCDISMLMPTPATRRAFAA